jgi:hypothetical protein
MPLALQDFGDAVPFYRCTWNSYDVGNAVDPGDFQLCMNSTIEGCLLYGCDWPKCKGLTNTILAQPSAQRSFNMQLVVYAGFFLVGLWTISQEADEKLHVMTALSLNRLFRDRVMRREWHWWTRYVITPGFLLLLAGIYIVCLYKGDIEERILVFSSPKELEHWSRYNVSRLGAARGMQSLSSAMGATLVWYCDGAGFDGILSLVYSSRDNEGLEIAVASGLYFFYTCYCLVSSQRKLYDFVNGDVLMDPDVACSYRSLHAIREGSIIMSRADVAEHLHRTVYLPFLREVHRLRPDLIQTLFNEYDAIELVRVIEEGEDDDAVEQEGQDEADRSAVMAYSPGRYQVILRRRRGYVTP